MQWVSVGVNTHMGITTNESRCAHATLLTRHDGIMLTATFFAGEGRCFNAVRWLRETAV